MSKRDHGGEEPPVDTKRARSSLSPEESNTHIAESVQVSSECEIKALPHVVNLLEMTLEEALKAEIEMNDLKWVQELLDRYICDVSDAMAEAAGLNRLDVVNVILTDISTNRSASSKVIDRIGSLLDDDSDDMLYIMQKGALSAARNGHVAVVERLLPIVIDQVRHSLLPLVDWFDVIRYVLDEEAQNEVVGFLVETGCVASEVFGVCVGFDPFKPACIDTVTFLHKLNRASPQCIDRALDLRYDAVVNLLFENEKISEGTIIAAFKRVMRRYSNDHEEIILFLYKQTCIPSSLIDTAFLMALLFVERCIRPGVSG